MYPFCRLFRNASLCPGRCLLRFATRRYTPPVSRVFLASIAGLVGFAAYLVAAVDLADAVIGRGVLAETLYFVLAGTLWVAPAWGLLIWAARGDRSGG